jgi:diamine N-acetyltransferase
MRTDVRLEDVTAANAHAVAALELAPSQEDLVASNAESLDDAKSDPRARPRAVYAGRRLVGFLMYDVPKPGGKSRNATIYRFMIDRRQQGKGYGRAALAAALAEIRSVPQVRAITICYMPENPVAKDFYASFGFVESGLDEDGEMVAELAL